MAPRASATSTRLQHPRWRSSRFQVRSGRLFEGRKATIFHPDFNAFSRRRTTVLTAEESANTPISECGRAPSFHLDDRIRIEASSKEKLRKSQEKEWKKLGKRVKKLRKSQEKE